MSWRDDWDNHRLLEARNEFISRAACWVFAMFCLLAFFILCFVDHDLGRERQKQKIAIHAAKARVLQRVADGAIHLSDSMLRDVLCGSNPTVIRKESERKYVNYE